MLFQLDGSALCRRWSVFCAVCVCVCVCVVVVLSGGNEAQKNKPLFKTQRLLFVWLLVVPCTQTCEGFRQTVKNCFKKLPCKQHGKPGKCGYYALFVLIHKKRSLFVCVLNLLRWHAKVKLHFCNAVLRFMQHGKLCFTQHSPGLLEKQNRPFCRAVVLPLCFKSVGYASQLVVGFLQKVQIVGLIYSAKKRVDIQKVWLVV